MLVGWSCRYSDINCKDFQWHTCEAQRHTCFLAL